MRRLFRLTFATIVMFTLILFAVRWIGSTQPLPSADLWNAIFTNPDGSPCQRPCMFGVRPGVTKFEDAADMIKAHPFVRKWLGQPDILLSNNPMLFSIRNADVFLELRGDNSDNKKNIASVELVLFDHVSLGEVLERFGLPEYVKPDPVIVYGNSYIGLNIRLDYETLGFQFAFSYNPSDVTKPDSPISSILLDTEAIATCRPFTCVKWQGFQSVEYYHESLLTPQP